MCQIRDYTEFEIGHTCHRGSWHHSGLPVRHTGLSWQPTDLESFLQPARTAAHSLHPPSPCTVSTHTHTHTSTFNLVSIPLYNPLALQMYLDQKSIKFYAHLHFWWILPFKNRFWADCQAQHISCAYTALCINSTWESVLAGHLISGLIKHLNPNLKHI